MTTGSEPRSSRRGVLIGGTGVVGAAGLLAACGDDPDEGSPDTGSTPTAGATSGDTGDGGAELAKTGDIPEGGGAIFADEGVVVTQPEAGTFKAFTSTCTHQGCTVGSVGDGLISCPCHGSQFSIADGSVQHGPATMALPEQDITVDGDSITLS